MADPKKPTAPGTDPRAVRDLAATLYAAALPLAKGKTPDSVAADCITQARAFFRAWDADQTTPPG